ncbi:MAG: rod shape-determining protein MreC [Deferrisomatales bacterium]|nr:rod shape-determining protein MreC [Deferrisomatales bacterium]
MLGFLARHRGVVVGAALVLLALGLLSAGSGSVGRSVGLLTAPAQSLVQGIASEVAGTVDRYLFLVEVQQEAERLRREVAELKRALLAVEEVQLENQRLHTLLAFKRTTDLELLPVRVVGRSASAWFRTVVLDKGTDDRIAVDSPVLTPAGVVGRVYQVTPTASRVLLITDANSAIDGLVQRTRSQVLVEGQLKPSCRALYIGRGEEVAGGDQVVTSGLGGVFPKGLLLGRLAEVEALPGAVFQRAELVPGADFSRLEEVFVGIAASAAASAPSQP